MRNGRDIRERYNLKSLLYEVERLWYYTRADAANLHGRKRSERTEAMTLHGAKP